MILIKAIHFPWNSCLRYLSFCSHFSRTRPSKHLKWCGKRKSFFHFMILNVFWCQKIRTLPLEKETYLNFTVFLLFLFFCAENSQSATDYHYLLFHRKIFVVFVSTFVWVWGKLLSRDARRAAVNNGINKF